MVFLGKLAFLGLSVLWDAYYCGILILSENHGLSWETSVLGIKCVVGMLLLWDPYSIRKTVAFLRAFPQLNVSWDTYYCGILRAWENCGLS